MRNLNECAKQNNLIFKKRYEWISLAIIMFIATTFYCSGDLGATASHGIYLWDSVLSGDFLQMYSNYVKNPLTDIAYYTPLLYFIFGIWNLPVYVIYKLGITVLIQKTYLSFGVMIWNKMLIFVFIVLMVQAIDSIAKTYQISLENRRMLFFSVLSSFLVIYPALVIGQYDVISVAVSLWGIVSYLKNDEKKFLLLFMVATGLKFFAVFIFIPLVLMSEKNVFKVFAKGMFAFIIPVVSRLLFGGDVAYAYVTEFSKQKTLSLLEKTIPGNFSTVPIIAVLLFCIYIFAYIIDSDYKKEYVIYISFAVFGIMFSFMFLATYWIILIAPYAMLICFLNLGKRQRTSVNFLMVLAFEVCICILTLYYHHDNLDYALLYRGVLYKEMKLRSPAFSIYGLVENYGMGIYITCIEALFMICIFYMFFLNLPTNKEEKVKLEEYHLSVHDKEILYMKSIVTPVFFAVTVMCFLCPVRLSYNFLELSYEGDVKKESDSYLVKENSKIISRRLILQPGEYYVKIMGDGMAAEGIDYYVQDCGMYGDAHNFVIEDNQVMFELSILQYSEDVRIVVNTNENYIKMKGIQIVDGY